MKLCVPVFVAVAVLVPETLPVRETLAVIAPVPDPVNEAVGVYVNVNVVDPVLLIVPLRV